MMGEARDAERAVALDGRSGHMESDEESSESPCNKGHPVKIRKEVRNSGAVPRSRLRNSKRLFPSHPLVPGQSGGKSLSEQALKIRLRELLGG